MTQLVVGDRAQETCTTTGTGTLSLLGAVTQFQSFAAVGVSTGNTTSYTTEFTVADQSGVNWETSIGVYTTSGSTLTRTTVLSSSNAGALVNFGAGTKNVFCTYSAVTSVSGGGGGTYPTIKPTLNLDFANSGTVDPRITFARATTATYYDGKTTAMAEQNLFIQSSAPSLWYANTTRVNSTIVDNNASAPDGTTTASLVTCAAVTGGVVIFGQPNILTTGNWLASIYVKAGTTSYLGIGSNNGLGSAAFNLATGTIIRGSGTITLINNGWYRVTTTVSVSGGGYGIYMGYTDVTGNATVTTSGTETLYIYGPQVEQRSSATAYTPTTTSAITNYIPVLMTAPSGVPRLDYNPITGKALGLLIEEQRVNLLLYSSTFTNAAWTLTNATLTAAATIAPDSTQTAFNLVSNTATGLQALAETVTKAASALAYTSTVYFKANQYTYSWLQISDGAGNGAIVYFNLTTGAISTAVAGIGTAFTALSASTPTAVGNGWYRCNITGTSNTATSLVTQFGSSTNGTSNSVVGNGYSGVYAWGAQLEAGSFATSYIPTTSAQVTRNSDQASITGTNFSSWYNQSQGAILVDYDMTNIATVCSAGNMYSSADLNSYSYVISAVNNSNNIRINNANTTVYSQTYSIVTQNLRYINILSYQNNNIKSIRSDSSTVTSQSSGTVPIVDTLTIAAGIDGHIRKLAYYPQALSSANLVALTS